MEILKEIQVLKNKHIAELEIAQAKKTEVQAQLNEANDYIANLGEGALDIINRKKKEIEILSIKKELALIEEVENELKNKRVNTTVSDVKKQYQDYVNEKYGHRNKIQEVKKCYDALILAIGELEAANSTMYKESFSLKKDIENYTNLSEITKSKVAGYETVRFEANQDIVEKLTNDAEFFHDTRHGNIGTKIINALEESCHF